ncbi:MAG: XdhC family protein [Acidobacteriota bacterium]|nr:XdhC family protein [Acidobacteriota bacterium]
MSNDLPTPQDPRQDELARARAWLAEGRRVALATVVSTWGSSPRATGSHLVCAQDGAFLGSVSGGCIEGSVITGAEDVMKDGVNRVLEFGVTNERAWEVGLTCGGKVAVLVEPFTDSEHWDTLDRERKARRGIARIVDLDEGRVRLLGGNIDRGNLELDETLKTEAGSLLRAGRSGMLTDPERRLFQRTYAPPARLIIVGAVHIAQTLAPMAALAGFAVTIVDPRRAFASKERFPNVPLLDQWPEDAFPQLELDEGCAVVTLGHDPKLDDPALTLALQSSAFYVGALGSKKTHAKRLARLGKQLDSGLLDRIHAPVGLNLGGRAPNQIAVSILAQIIQVRCQ